MFIVLAKSKEGIDKLQEIENLIYGSSADEKINRIDKNIIEYILNDYEYNNEKNLYKLFKIYYIDNKYINNISISGTCQEYIICNDTNNIFDYIEIDLTQLELYKNSIDDDYNTIDYHDFLLKPNNENDNENDNDNEDDLIKFSINNINENHFNDIDLYNNDYYRNLINSRYKL